LPALPSLPFRVAAGALLEAIVGDPGIVLQGDPRRVPEPGADDVDRKLLQKLGLPTRPLVVKEETGIPRFMLLLQRRLETQPQFPSRASW